MFQIQAVLCPLLLSFTNIPDTRGVGSSRTRSNTVMQMTFNRKGQSECAGRAVFIIPLWVQKI